MNTFFLHVREKPNIRIYFAVYFRNRENSVFLLLIVSYFIICVIALALPVRYHFLSLFIKF